MKKESSFQSELIKDLGFLFPGCLVLKNDPAYIQGFPDLTILYNDRWALLECKRSIHEPYRPNQEKYLDWGNQLSFAAMICPENREAVLNDLQYAFES